MNTEAQRRAHAAYVERLKAEGGKSITLRISKAAYEALQRDAAVYGSQAAAIEAVLLSGRPEPVVQAPKVAARPKTSDELAGLKDAVAIATGEDQPERVSTYEVAVYDPKARRAKPKIGKGKSK